MDKQAETVSDQRKFPRISKTVTVEVNPLTYPLPREPGERCVSKNISGGGICFTISKRYKPETLLNLKISIPGWQSYKKPFSRIMDIASESPLTAIAEVVWCQKLSNGSGYDVGIKFVNIYEDDYSALMNYVENLKREA